MRITTKQELIDCLKLGQIAELANDIDFSGGHSVPVQSVLDLNGHTIFCNELFASTERFAFLLQGGSITNGTIVGPNGNSFAQGGMFFGAVRSTKGRLESVNFYDCDKWAVDCRGLRALADDTTTISKCNFRGIKREGFGYAIWNQYNRAVIENCTFDDCRTFIDGGSEAYYYEIRNNVFGERHYNFAINAHEYGTSGSKSGAGMVFENNQVFGTTQVFQLHNPFNGKIVISGNKFECAQSKLGTISGVPIEQGNNTFNGVGMNPAPEVDGKVAVNKGETISFKVKNYDTYDIKSQDYKVGISIHEIVGVGRDDIRSLMTRKTVNINDTGKYLAFALKCNGATVEVMKDGIVIDTLSPSDWQYFHYDLDLVKLRLLGGGEIYMDDFCRNNIGETFETTNKIKIHSYSTPSIKASRYIGESASGMYCMRFTMPVGSSLMVE